MKLHLPVFLRKSLLSCLSAFIVCTVGSGAAWADPQNLTFGDSFLAWDTQSESFVNEEGNAAAFAEGDNVSFTGESDVALGQDITAGTVAIEQGAAVAIDLDVFVLNVDRIELSGLLDMGYSLHIGEGTTLAVQSASAVLDSNLVLGDKGGFEVGAAVSLNHNALTLQGNTSFTLTAAGDGKTYTLLTGVSALLDAQGNAISLDSSNNAISNYFDASQPGTGFWANGTLQLNDGALQLVLHNEAVKEAMTVITRQENPAAYQYYAGVRFENIEYDIDSFEAFGGAIEGTVITLNNNGSVIFSGNSVSATDASYAYADARGGAIYGEYDSTITLNNNGSVTFIGNTASATASINGSSCGGAIFGGDITLSDNGSIEFSGNTAVYGGAIYGGDITLSNNGSVELSGNESKFAGAIFGCDINLIGNESLLFQGNKAIGDDPHGWDGYGGAIADESGVGSIILMGNKRVAFIENVATSAGGAIDASRYEYQSKQSWSNIEIEGNGRIEFTGNRVDGDSYEARGGAIASNDLSLCDNGDISFVDNVLTTSSFYAYGGAIDGYNITLNNNRSIIFSGNSASSIDGSSFGGAIDGGDITLNNNGSVTFSGNMASSDYAYGGAIYAGGDLSIRNNEAVLFEKNAEITNGRYRLRSIYASGGSGDVASLSASEGNSIEFRDSVYIGSGATTNLNADYTDAAGVVHKQKGDILFTGAYTETHLNDILKADGAGRTATAQEIINSRTSEVYAMTHLYGGRLRVEDGAIYKGYGITAEVDSDSTVRVKDATLDHAGYGLTFNSGTTLELVGTNSISGNVQMLEGSTLAFSALGSHGVTSISGNLTFGDTLTIAGLDTWQGENHILIYTQGNVSGWDADNITIQGTSVNNLTWVNDFLVLNYNSDTFKVDPFRGDVSYTTRLTGDVNCQYYQSVSFKDITYDASSADASAYGGAIYGGTITLRDNGSVMFSGNTASASADAYASACGGAIYGADSSTITLSENGSVTFSGNTANASASAATYADATVYASGGAIEGVTIILSENGSVTFSGNTASATATTSATTSAYAYARACASGGAICSSSTITLSDNGSVTFSGNTASASATTSAASAATGAAEASADGGAINGCTITLSENGSVTFSGNTASATAYATAGARGGAIYSYGNLNIQNNESVLFEKNAEITNGTYRLRSIYAGETGDVISLSAAEGKSIEFRDSVYIDSGSTVNLNADYTDAAGVVHKQAGDILFTGAYTETHLNDLLDAAGAGRTATAQEILNSRTSEVRAMTNLYGGRLRVEDGAIYKSNGITAMEGSEATVLVKDATLDHQGYELTFNAGTTLELVGTNSISGNVQMLEGSALRLVFNDPSATGAVLTLNDSLTLKKGSLVEKVGSDDKLTLQGGGKLCLDGGVDFSAFALGKEWTGTVKLANITTDTNLIMNTIGQACSTIELENVMGYTGVNGKTVAANLVLTRSCDANGAEQAAFRVSNGYSNAASDYVMTTFSGTVSGDGKMVFDKMLSGVYTGFKFTGDVADWTGAFEMNAGKTFNLAFGGSATEINADIRDVSKSSTLNLILQADSAMSVNGDVVTDSISVTNVSDVSFSGTVNTGALTAENSNITIASGAEVSGDMTVAGLLVQSGGSLTVGGELSASGAEVSFLGTVNVGALTAENSNITIASGAEVSGDMIVAGLLVQNGGSLTVGGTLCAGEITMDTISANSSALMVGQFGAGDTIFHLDIDDLNALNLGHGEIVTIARADQTIGGGFTAWLTSAGSTSLDAGVYRYDISVENIDVVVTLDYANWGTRVWYGNTWEGLESWEDYMVCGYDAVDGVETVDLDGAEYEGSYLLVAPGRNASTTVFRNGNLIFEAVEIADSRVEIASDTKLEVYGNLDASGKEMTLHGTMEIMDAQIGALSGTSGTLTIVEDGMVSIGSNVTLGKLQNNGTLDIGKNKLNVAGAVTTGGNVVAGEVVVHNRANSPAKFNALVADKVTVTNTLSNYEDAISLGDGSAVGELYAEKLEVREGTVTLGYADKATQQTVQNLDVKKAASLVLNQQTELSVSNSLTAAENATVQLKQNAALNYQELSISNKHADKTVSVNAAQLASNSSELVLQDAHVKSTASGTCELGYQLVNSSVENAGSGTLQVTNGNNTLSGVVASGGNVDIFNAAPEMTMEDMKVATGLSVSVMVGASGTTSANAEVVVTGTSLLGGNSTLNADLTLAEGATLDMNSLESGAVVLNGTLSIGGQIIMGENLLATLNEKPGEARSVTIFTGLDAVDMSAVTGSPTSNRVWAGVIFSNMSGSSYCYLNYVAETGSLVAEIVPEPATATLSLLALAALAARRRRKS